MLGTKKQQQQQQKKKNQKMYGWLQCTSVNIALSGNRKSWVILKLYGQKIIKNPKLLYEPSNKHNNHAFKFLVHNILKDFQAVLESQ